MFLIKISNADISFNKRTLTWRTYTTNEALPTPKQVQIVDPKESVLAALDINSKTFVIDVAIWEQEEILVHSKKQAQVGALLFDKASTEVPAEYSNYSNVFSAKNAAEFPENTRTNEHAIKREDDKQPPFGLIYSLGSVELETLKTYIKTNLANNFIQPSKSPSRVPILFDRKPDRNLCLCVD